MIRTLIALAVAGAFALPMATSAAGDMTADKKAATGAGRDARFDELDRNHDGFISRDEGKDAEELNTRFSELDVNNDNKLSREEYNALSKSARGASEALGQRRLER
jgi:Ni/Co efflux regulator RcnB